MLECSFFEHKNPPFSKMPCIIYLHANGCNRLEGFQFMELILSSAMSYFCFDFSACGKSEGQYSSIGWHEKNDIETIVQYLTSTGRIDKIGLWGRSMGAVAAVLYAENDPRITCIVVDSCFTSFKLLVKEIAKSKASIPGFLASGAFSILRKTINREANFDLNSIKPIKIVSNLKIPALFGHALQDTLIPPEHSKELHKTYGGPKQIVIFEGDHNSSRSVNFVLVVREFFKKYLVGDRKSETVMVTKSQIPVYSTGFGIKNKIISKGNLKVISQERITSNDKYGLNDKHDMQDNRLVVTERGNNNKQILNGKDCQKRHYRHSSFVADAELSKLACWNENSILRNSSNNSKILGKQNDKKLECTILLDNSTIVKAYSQFDLYNKTNTKQDSQLNNLTNTTHTLKENLYKSPLINKPATDFVNNNSSVKENLGYPTSRLYGTETRNKILSSSNLESILYTQKENSSSFINYPDKTPSNKDKLKKVSCNSHSTTGIISNENQLQPNSSQSLADQASPNLELKQKFGISSSPLIYEKACGRFTQANNIKSFEHKSPKILKLNLNINNQASSKSKKINLDELDQQNLTVRYQVPIRGLIKNSPEISPGIYQNDSKMNNSIFNEELIVHRDEIAESSPKNEFNIIYKFCVNSPNWASSNSEEKGIINSYASSISKSNIERSGHTNPKSNVNDKIYTDQFYNQRKELSQKKQF